MGIDTTFQNIWKNFNDNFWEKTNTTLLPSYQNLTPEGLLETSVTRENYTGVVKALGGEIDEWKLCEQIDKIIAVKDDKCPKCTKILQALFAKHKEMKINPITLELLGKTIRHQKPKFFKLLEKELWNRGIREADFENNMRYLDIEEKKQEEMFHLAANSRFFKKGWFEGVIESACFANKVSPINECAKYGADMSLGNCHENLGILSHQLMTHSPDYDPTPISIITKIRKTNREDIIDCLQALLRGYTVENLKDALNDKNLNFPEETKKFINAELKIKIKKHIKTKLEDNKEEEITV